MIPPFIAYTAISLNKDPAACFETIFTLVIARGDTAASAGLCVVHLRGTSAAPRLFAVPVQCRRVLSIGIGSRAKLQPLHCLLIAPHIAIHIVVVAREAVSIGGRHGSRRVGAGDSPVVHVHTIRLADRRARSTICNREVDAAPIDLPRAELEAVSPIISSKCVRRGSAISSTIDLSVQQRGYSASIHISIPVPPFSFPIPLPRTLRATTPRPPLPASIRSHIIIIQPRPPLLTPSIVPPWRTSSIPTAAAAAAIARNIRIHVFIPSPTSTITPRTSSNPWRLLLHRHRHIRRPRSRSTLR